MREAIEPGIDDELGGSGAIDTQVQPETNGTIAPPLAEPPSDPFWRAPPAPFAGHRAPKPPRLGGWMLSALQRLSTLPGTSAIVRHMVTELLGIRALAALPQVYRGELPDDMRPVRAREARPRGDGARDVPRQPAWPRGIESYRDAYASGRTSPAAVVDRALSSLRALGLRSPSMNVLASCDPEEACRAARASSERYARGTARPLEGIPFLVKDQHDVAGLPTRFGARHVPSASREDATLVARLRAAGAVVLGKSVMTEFGISPLGVNVHMTLPKNAHDPSRAAGGSSTGSAVAVALGIGPFATGADAGGSVRVPAVCNGVMGIKPTFGRISRMGEEFSGSLNHLGLIGTTAWDLALLLDVVASQPDPADAMTAWAPPPPPGGFAGALNDGVRGLRIGVDDAQWRDADPIVASTCRAALAVLEREGATIVPVRVPLAKHATAIGVATLGCEGVALASTVAPRQYRGMAPDLRLAVNVAAGVRARDYLDVQRLRVGLRRQVACALREVDVLASPVIPCTTPRLADDDRRRSFSDAALVSDLCRYALVANLTGVPAASAPVGVDASGLPIGLEITGDAWDEAAVLGVIAHLERTGAAEIRRPRGAIDLLQEEGAGR